MPIRKRNLDNSLIQWIMTATGLGPGIGEIKYVAKPTSATNQFRTQLQSMGVPDADIFTTPKLAEAACETDRNDVVLVFPGIYTGTSADPLTWNLDHTHLMGLNRPAGPECVGGGAIIRTISTTGVYAIHFTGNSGQVHNLSFQNWGQATAAVAAVKESGNLNFFKGVTMMGLIRSQQSQNADCTTLWINTAVGNAGKGDRFDDCTIGDTGGATATVSNGTILFGPTGTVGAACQMTFNKCQILSRAEDNDPCSVLVKANYCMDRLILFDRCVFYNFSENHSTAPDYVIRDACNTTHDILLKDCTRVGFDAWTNLPAHCFISSGTTQTTAGGVAVAAA